MLCGDNCFTSLQDDVMFIVNIIIIIINMIIFIIITAITIIITVKIMIMIDDHYHVDHYRHHHHYHHDRNHHDYHYHHHHHHTPILASNAGPYPGTSSKPVGMWVTIGGELNRPAHTVRARFLLLNSKQRVQPQPPLA
jgi:hypothetical protein